MRSLNISLLYKHFMVSILKGVIISPTTSTPPLLPVLGLEHSLDVIGSHARFGLGDRKHQPTRT